MKQIIQNYKTGELRVAEVPKSTLRPQGMLVRTPLWLWSRFVRVFKKVYLCLKTCHQIVFRHQQRYLARQDFFKITHKFI